MGYFKRGTDRYAASCQYSSVHATPDELAPNMTSHKTRRTKPPIEAQEAEPSPPVLDISNVIAAFSEDQVERIIGLSKGRLRYWAKTQFFKPGFVEDNPHVPFSRFYSFKDVVALRTLEMLRVQNNIPLQRLRKVAEELRDLKDNLWTATKLYAFNRRVILVDHSATRAQGHDVLSKQYLLAISLEQIIGDTRRELTKLCQRPGEYIGTIQKQRSIARNAWTVAGTRITVGSIKRLHEDGYTTEQIIDEFPDLTKEDVEAALTHDGSKAA